MSLYESTKQVLDSEKNLGCTKTIIKLFGKSHEFSAEAVDSVLENDLLSTNDPIFELAFYNYLLEHKAFETIYEINFSKKLAEINYQAIDALLKSLLEMGRIKDFKLKAKQTNEFLITNKYYSKYREFISSFSNELKTAPFFTAGRLLYYCDIGDGPSIEVLLNEQFYLAIDSKIEKSFVEILYNILEQIEKDHFKIHKNKLRLKLLLTVFGKYDLRNKDLIESLLLASESSDFFLILECIKNRDLRVLIFTYMTKRLELKLNIIPHLFKETRNLFEKTISVSKVSAYIDKIEDKFEPIESTQKPQSEINELKIQQYSLCEEEGNLIKHFKYDDREELVSSDLVVSFINLEFLTLAENTAKKLDESSNKYYLLSTVYLERGEFSEAIYFANKCLNEYKLKGEDVIPFEYIKAQAFHFLKNKEMESECYKRIVAYDPSFQNAKEKI